jgi:hypothetical protein
MRARLQYWNGRVEVIATGNRSIGAETLLRICQLRQTYVARRQSCKLHHSDLMPAEVEPCMRVDKKSRQEHLIVPGCLPFSTFQDYLHSARLAPTIYDKHSRPGQEIPNSQTERSVPFRSRSLQRRAHSTVGRSSKACKEAGKYRRKVS